MRWRWLGLVALATLLLAADPSSALALSSSTGFEGRYSYDCVAEDVLAIQSQEAGRLPDRPAECRGDSRVAEVRLRPSDKLSVPNGAGTYAPDRPLARTRHGDPIPDVDVPHT